LTEIDRFTSLLVNGVNTGAYTNVRQNTNYNSPVRLAFFSIEYVSLLIVILTR
jgi:hypothetical protein